MNGLLHRAVLSDDAELWLNCDGCMSGVALLTYPADCDPLVLVKDIQTFVAQHLNCREPA